MTGRIYIDGIDAYAAYNLFVTNGGYTSLLAYPPLKAVDTNDWAEDDGIEVDLSNPVLDTRNVSIPFASHNEVKTWEFLELLSDMAYHTFDFREIGRVFRLRLVSTASIDIARGLELFTLQFANDFPLPEGYTYRPPASNLPSTGYELASIDFCRYGIQVLKGSEKEVWKAPAVKKRLTRNFRFENGAEYDAGPVTYQAKDVRIFCLMRADTLDDFWRNYDAFLYDLIRVNETTRSGEKMLYFSFMESEYPSYYKSSDVIRFYPTGKIWFEFSVTFVFTDFRPSDYDYLLAAENGALITTETGVSFIDMHYGN